RWSAKASIAPSTRSAPTTCEFSPGRDRAQNYGLGTYPAKPRPSRGSSASWSPFLFGLDAEQASSCFLWEFEGLDIPHASMVNRVLTSPYLWWFDPFSGRSQAATGCPRVLALKVWL